jgi:hypothetical protein
VPSANAGRDQPVTHYNLNRIILGVAAIYAVVIIAAAIYGPLPSDDEPELAEYTPGFVDSSSGTPTPHTGVGGVSGDEETIAGTIIDSESGEPLAGVSVSVETDDDGEIITTTGADGRFEIRDVSQTVTVAFSLSGYATIEQELAPSDEHIVELEPPYIAGRVINTTGSPVRGATIAAGEVFTRSVENGNFRLEHLPEDAEIVVKAAGYEPKVIPQGDFEHGFVLESTSVNAIYAPASVLGNESEFSSLLALVDSTDLNAVVFDLKDHLGRVHFASESEQVQEIGASEPAYDLQAVLDELDERGIKAIARVVVFEDPYLAESRTDLAIQDTFSDDLWRTWQGRAWTNPYREEVWEYNITLIQEIAGFGVDEILLASVQFPESGLVNRADFGQVSTANRRQQAIADFLELAYASIASSPTMLTTEIFAMSLWDESNSITGQDLTTMVERVDYINPLLFPSHFASGSLGYDDPGSAPAAMVGRSIESGQDLLPRHLHARIRPWLQAFSYGSAMPFDTNAIRAQIDAAEEFGAGGWMLWNPDGSYDPETFAADDSH